MIRVIRQTFLPFSPPYVCEEAINEVIDTLRGQWITTGPKTKRFEFQFAEYVGAPEHSSVMLNSCTAALHLALAVLGIGPGDEVIVPTLTFAATANVVVHVGARPVLVDVLPDTLCIDPERVEAAITPRTRAIIAVHFAGHPADLDAINMIARRHRLEVIEDAAHALPAWYRGTMVGSGANFTAFSFYATKNLTTGEGGALTGHPDLHEDARVLGLHGMSRDAWKRFDADGSWRYDIVAPGFKYNMTDIQASIGMHQLRNLDMLHRRRQHIVKRYNMAFCGYDALEVPIERSDVISSCHLYVLRLRPELLNISRDRFIEELKVRNIGSSVHFLPLHTMSFYAKSYGYRPQEIPVGWDAGERIISLPLHPFLTDDDIQDVIDAVLDIADGSVRH